MKKIDDKKYLNITILVLFIYGILMFYFCVRTDALSQDEGWFYSIAASIKPETFLDVLKIPNYLGYGAIYWTIFVLLKSIMAMRIFSWCNLMVLPVCVIAVIKKYFRYEWKCVLIAIFMLLSFPMTWFTGKIIGPELCGNAFGAIGITIILVNSYKNQRWRNWCYFIGSFLIGISAGIKIYNLIFGLYIGLYSAWVVFSDRSMVTQDKLQKILKQSFGICIGCTLGYIIANPFLMIDSSLIVKPQIVEKRDMASWLSHIITEKSISWDLINVGGFSHAIMPLFVLLCLLGATFVGGGQREKGHAVISGIVFLVLTLCFLISPTFEGWYYMPLLFVIPLNVRKKNIYWILLIVNIFFMYSDIAYQISYKVVQLNHIDNEDKIQAFIDANYEEYPEYSKIYYVDSGMKGFGMDVIFQYKAEGNQFIVISDKARKNKDIQALYQMAINGERGYSFISREKDISIIVHNSGIFDNVFFENAAETSANPYGMTAGVIEMENEGRCILLTPNTSFRSYDIGKWEMAAFSYMIHPWVRSDSDGAGMDIVLYDSDGKEIYRDKIRVNANNGWCEYRLNISSYANADVLKIICSDGGNNDDRCDWLVLKML